MFKSDIKVGLEVTVRNVTKDKEYVGKVAGVGDKAFTMRTVKGHLISAPFADELIVNGTPVTEKPARKARVSIGGSDYKVVDTKVNPFLDHTGKRFILLDRHGHLVNDFDSYSGAWQSMNRKIAKAKNEAAAAPTEEMKTEDKQQVLAGEL